MSIVSSCYINRGLSVEEDLSKIFVDNARIPLDKGVMDESFDNFFFGRNRYTINIYNTTDNNNKRIDFVTSNTS